MREIDRHVGPAVRSAQPSPGLASVGVAVTGNGDRPDPQGRSMDPLGRPAHRPTSFVAAAIPAGWATANAWSAVTGALSGEGRAAALLAGGATAGAVVASVLLARGLLSVGLTTMFATAAMCHGAPVAAGVTVVAALAWSMVTLLEPPGAVERRPRGSPPDDGDLPTVPSTERRRRPGRDDGSAGMRWNRTGG
jgi:hypothetical protein